MRPIQKYSLNLGEILRLVGATSTMSEPELSEISITGATHRDSGVESGDLFLAIPGTKHHGANFARKAKENGALAMLSDQDGAKIFGELPTLIVKNPREAAAMIVAALYREPMRDLHSIGITGTNGKTTVTTLLHQIFQLAGRESGLIGTVETRIGRESFKSERTTPEASELQALAAVMKERHIRHLVMEVSSHAMSMQRMKGAHFSFVGFTNLTQDHLDFHGGMQEYFEAKSKLFTFEFADLGFINIDDKYGQILEDTSEIPTISLSRSNKDAEWHYVNSSDEKSGVRVQIRGTGGILIETMTPLRGGYNLDNLLMAIAIAHEAGVDPVEIAAIIPKVHGAPGRLDSVNVGQGFGAFVDYAHTPDAVSNVLRAAKEFTTGKVIAVLGCGGDRDASKRPLMGKALIQNCDVSIFTSDNPRSENPEAILKDMVGDLHVTSPSKVMSDRAQAIEYAVSLAGDGDCVLILGKGHESGQEVAGVITPFDDKFLLANSIEAKR
jgi:UDP-N-acetylmuramoyl-L-alanyl-D-glutamate--2,6-diaminopimelate ligase